MSWPRQKGTTLPAEPDSKALNEFLLAQKQKDPDHFPDLSLAVIKLMGPGEYVLVKPNAAVARALRSRRAGLHALHRAQSPLSRRGNAAPLKAWLTKSAAPYSEDDLNAIAQRCTEMEDAARKVEREMQKRIAAVALHPHIGQTYNAIVTGVNQYGTFVRTLDPHVEGMVVRGGKGLDVGDRVTVKLVITDPERGLSTSRRKTQSSVRLHPRSNGKPQPIAPVRFRGPLLNPCLLAL